MTNRSSRVRRWTALTAGLVLVVSAAACGSDDDTSEPAEAPEATSAEAPEATSAEAPEATSAEAPVDDGELDAILAQVFQTDSVSADDVHPLILEALSRATTELSAEQLDVAFACWEGTDCEVPGGGDVTLAIADSFGGNTWRRISKMETILQALTYPEIGRIISSDANFDLATYQSQVRGAAAQGADLIVGYNDFGDTMLPTFQDAQDEGAYVSVYVGPVPSAGADAIVTQVVTATCESGQSMAETAIEIIGGEGTVAFFNGTPGNPQGAEWNECALDALETAGGGVTQTFSADTNWTPAGAAEAASALIGSGETVDAILYDYADPLPGVVDTFVQAGETPPALVTWTMNNDLFRVWEEAQGTENEFQLYYTNGLNWVARVSVTAVMNALAGNPSDAVINYPMPFVAAKVGDYLSDKPGDFPGSAVVPDALLERMIG
jgi:ABC-type sugar transport system substrate-binding protein